MKKKISKKLRRGYNDLGTLYPELAKEWHPTKNGDLTANDVTVNSSRVIWWICSNGHEWRATISCRILGCGCPMEKKSVDK